MKQRPLAQEIQGVPSYHFYPVFAQQVADKLEDKSLDSVALELPPCALPELMWAVEQWPQPVASLAHIDGNAYATIPFIPGDSILEAARIATKRGLPIYAVDKWISEKSAQRTVLQLPDPEWAKTHPQEWLETVANKTSSATMHDVAREAEMASQLHRLMTQGKRMLWVGGAAHWARILERIKSRNFTPPIMQEVECITFQRVRLDAGALIHLSGRAPYFVHRFTQNPRSYDELNAFHSLAAAAIPEKKDAPIIVVETTSAATFEIELEREPTTPQDAARTVMYARNLTACSSLKSTPDIPDLLRAAQAVVGPKYAGRIYELLSKTPFSSRADLPCLTYEKRGKRSGFWLGDQAIDVHSNWQAENGGIDIYRLKPKPRPEEDYKKLCGRGGAKKASYTLWLCHPEDRASYRKFVKYLFRVANSKVKENSSSAPFRVGMGEGIDVRATLRAIHNDEIWIREGNATSLHFTNAVIDWQFDSEFCEELQSGARGGWIDPSEYFDLGSVSRETAPMNLIRREPFVQLDHRNWTLLTLDLGTTTKKGTSFYDKVIQPLVKINHSIEIDNIYHWLEIMFRFCAGKPFAYFSRYVPSRRIYRLAREHRVRLQHFPLQILSQRLRQRNQHFRFMSVTGEKWQCTMTEEWRSQTHYNVKS